MDKIKEKYLYIVGKKNIQQLVHYLLQLHTENTPWICETIQALSTVTLPAALVNQAFIKWKKL